MVLSIWLSIPRCFNNIVSSLMAYSYTPDAWQERKEMFKVSLGDTLVQFSLVVLKAIYWTNFIMRLWPVASIPYFYATTLRLQLYQKFFDFKAKIVVKIAVKRYSPYFPLTTLKLSKLCHNTNRSVLGIWENANYVTQYSYDKFYF